MTVSFGTTLVLPIPGVAEVSQQATQNRLANVLQPLTGQNSNTFSTSGFRFLGMVNTSSGPIRGRAASASKFFCFCNTKMSSRYNKARYCATVESNYWNCCITNRYDPKKRLCEYVPSHFYKLSCHACQGTYIRIFENFKHLSSNFCAHQLYRMKIVLDLERCRPTHFVSKMHFCHSAAKH